MDNDTTTTPIPFNPARNALKSVLLVTLFFATFLASSAAFIFRRCFMGQHNSPVFTHVFSFISVFGAGVFLATCLLDLLPDSIENVAKAELAMGHPIGFPLAELCIAGGFLLVLFIEQAIVYANEKKWIGDSEMERLLSHQESASLPDTVVSRATATRVAHAEHMPGSGVNGLPVLPEDGVAPSVDPHFQPDSHSNVRAVLLVLALSLHASFEGLSLGMINDVSQLIQIYAALLIHKTVIGFSLGIRLVQSRLRHSTIVICFLTFAAQILVGGFLGLALMSALSQESKIVADLVSGLMQAMACGTFLYITCFEILPHELNQTGYRPVKMLFLIIGFSVIALFICLFPDAS